MVHRRQCSDDRRAPASCLWPATFPRLMGEPDPDLWPRTLTRLASHEALTADEAADAMTAIMSGDATPGQIGAFLMALRTKGETVDEIEGLTRTMLAFANLVKPPAPVVDTCGTGGDRSGTFNISTLPAGPVAQVVGVSDERMLPLMAEVLARRGVRAKLFRGEDGLDELTTTGISTVYDVREGAVRETHLDPTSLGIAGARPDDLKG